MLWNAEDVNKTGQTKNAVGIYVENLWKTRAR